MVRGYCDHAPATTEMVRGCCDRAPAKVEMAPEARRHPASIPPSGRSPIMEVGPEIRRLICAELLPAKSEIFHPVCHDMKHPKRKATEKDNMVTRLMLVCKKFRDEIAGIVYDERTYVLHVHEGLKHGGVEFLDSGRQALQFQERSKDMRFAKFGSREVFGFQRIKKVVVEIHPTTEDSRDGGPYVSVNTYLMIRTLCRLLQSKDTRMTSINIRFVSPFEDRSGMQTLGMQPASSGLKATEPWGSGEKPRSSSVGDIFDVEMALRPLSMLTGCHNVSIELPSYLADNEQLSAFTKEVERSMRSPRGTLAPYDRLESHVEFLRDSVLPFIAPSSAPAGPSSKTLTASASQDAEIGRHDEMFGGMVQPGTDRNQEHVDLRESSTAEAESSPEPSSSAAHKLAEMDAEGNDDHMLPSDSEDFEEDEDEEHKMEIENEEDEDGEQEAGIETDSEEHKELYTDEY